MTLEERVRRLERATFGEPKPPFEQGTRLRRVGDKSGDIYMICRVDSDIKPFLLIHVEGASRGNRWSNMRMAQSDLTIERINEITGAMWEVAP